jgi:hypothetical protein
VDISSNINQLQSLIGNSPAQRDTKTSVDKKDQSEFASFFEKKLIDQKAKLNDNQNEPVLSSKEEATLDALFGLDSNDKSSFYGRRKLQNIHRGHLIDIKG